MSGEKERVSAYLDTVARLEPEIAPVDLAAAAASIAISLRRIADVLEGTKERPGLVDTIYNAMMDWVHRR